MSNRNTHGMILPGSAAAKRAGDMPQAGEGHQFLLGAAIAGKAHGFVGYGAAADQLIVGHKRPVRSWI